MEEYATKIANCRRVLLYQHFFSAWKRVMFYPVIAVTSAHLYVHVKFVKVDVLLLCKYYNSSILNPVILFLVHFSTFFHFKDVK